MTRPITVAFFLPHLEAGGVERVVLNLLVHLDRRRFRPALILNQRAGALVAEVPDDVAILDLEGRAMRQAIPSLRRCLARCGADVVYGGTNAANLAVLLATRLMRPRPAVIASEHTPPSLFLHNAKWRPLRIAMMRLLYPRAERIAVPLPEIGEELRQILERPRLAVAVLPNPVVESGASQGAEQGPPAPWMAPGTPLLVSAGRLVELKGFDIVIAALARLGGELGESRLVILGEGPERRALEATARALGLEHRVRLPGLVPNPVDYFRHADIVVLASRREGFVYVLVEAMAVGTPVIATDCPVGPRRILEEGAAGLLVPPEDPGALAKAIAALLGDRELAARLSARGRERAMDFAIAVAVPRFEELIQELVKT